MNLQEKLDAIKEKPLHIRIRYVFACIFVSMVGILFIWAISLKQNFSNVEKSSLGQDSRKDVLLDSALQEIREEKASFKQMFLEEDLPTESK